MSVQKLERVLWRLRKRCPGQDRPPWLELKRAIMYECGTDPTTYLKNKKALVDLGWIISYSGKRVELTGLDLE